MKVNSIQSNNTSFRGIDKNTYRETSEQIKKITNNHPEKEIKTPGEIAFSAGLVLLKTFVCGVAAAMFTAAIFKTAPQKTQKALKSVSNNLIDFSKKIVENPQTKKAKANNFIKNAVGKTEEVARKAYKKVICSGFEAIPKEADAETIKKITKANNLSAFKRLGGFSALASLTPAIFQKDEDGNGVKDILERVKKRSDNLDDKFNMIGEDVIAATQLTQMIK